MLAQEGAHRLTLAEAQEVLDRWVRPAIHGHAGDVHVVSVSETGDVVVEFEGACRACPLKPVTLGTAVQPAFEGVPGFRSVRCESVNVSSHAMRRMAEMMRPVAL